MTHPLRVERDTPRAGTWRLVLDEPQRANPLSRSLVQELQAALQAAFAADARAILLESAGERFCAGFDLGDIESTGDAELRERFALLEDTLESIRRAPLLTIALVRGPAFGAGADLVASCDYRLGMAGARFAFPGSRFGVVLGTRHLAALVGRQRAREILVEGCTLDADAALACGLLSERLEPDVAETRIDEILRGAERLDLDTLRSILRLTRDRPSGIDGAELARATSREGLAERMRAHARRAAEARAARRKT